MIPDEAKALLPFVQAIADKKVVEERFRDPHKGSWSAWDRVDMFISAESERHQLRIVEPEKTQEEMDQEAYSLWRCAREKVSTYEAWHAALAWERKEKGEK